VIEELVAARLITSDEDVVELAHEAIARAWPRLREWLDDDVEGQRIWRHLSAAADAWESMGRPNSELYRGVRLARAMEWRHFSRPDLNSTEVAFLDASWAAAEESRAQKRRASRTRRLIIGTVGVLAVVAVGLGLFALSQRQATEEQARIVRVADLAAAVTEHLETDPELASFWPSRQWRPPAWSTAQSSKWPKRLYIEPSSPSACWAGSTTTARESPTSRQTAACS
jgi:hypothetical protein